MCEMYFQTIHHIFDRNYFSNSLILLNIFTSYLSFYFILKEHFQTNSPLRDFVAIEIL
jgi:hypothetical protein